MIPFLHKFSRRESRVLWHLAWPGIVAQLGMMLTGVVDTLMLGRVSVEALAGVALGHAWVGATLFTSTGLLMGLDPFISQAHGARDEKALGLTLQRGLLLALLASLPICAAYTQTEAALLALGQDPAIAHAALEYISVQYASVPVFMLGTALRQYMQGRGLVRPIMWVMIGINVINVIANWVLIFGHWGFDAQQLVGAGRATNLARICYGLGMFLVFRQGKLHRGGWSGWSCEALSLGPLLKILKVGLPIVISFGLEIWAFMGTSMIAGLIHVEALAAHQIVLNLAALAFMVPMGFSLGTSTRVGNLAGSGTTQGVQRASHTALKVGLTMMACLSLLFLLGRNTLPLLYTSNPAVISLCSLALPVVAAFQLVDGTQVISAGILRGLGITKITAVANVAAYLLVGVPLGAYLGLYTSLGFAGIWIGLFAGLAIAAIVLTTAVFIIEKKPHSWAV